MQSGTGGKDLRDIEWRNCNITCVDLSYQKHLRKKTENVLLAPNDEAFSSTVIFTSLFYVIHLKGKSNLFFPHCAF